MQAGEECREHLPELVLKEHVGILLVEERGSGPVKRTLCVKTWRWERLKVLGSQKAPSLAGPEVIERHRVISLRSTSHPTLGTLGHQP